MDDKIESSGKFDQKKDGIEIPTKYQGLPSEMVENIWVDTVSGNEEENTRIAAEREQAISLIKDKEAKREARKATIISEHYQRLSPIEKSRLTELHDVAKDEVRDFLIGKKDLPLLPEEEFVLDKMKINQEEAGDKELNHLEAMSALRENDQRVYNNLVNRLAFSKFEQEKLKKKALDAKNQIDTITRSIGLDPEASGPEIYGPKLEELLRNSQEIDTKVQLSRENNYEKEKSLEEIKKELELLSKENYLIAHQTSIEAAEKISTKDRYFSGGAGIVGTSLMLTPKEIMRVLPELDKRGPREYGLTHDGAESMVIMAFPKELLEHELEKYKDSIATKKINLDTIDEILTEKYSQGELEEIGLPRGFVFGYYYEGKLNKNPDFTPKFEEPEIEKNEQENGFKVPPDLAEELPRSLNFLSNSLSELNYNRLNPLLDDDQVQSLSSIANTLGQELAKGNIDTERLVSILNRTNEIFEDIGRIRRQVPRRSESDYLNETRRGMGYFLNKLQELENLANTFEREKDDMRVTIAVGKTIETLKAKNRGVTNLIEKLHELGSKY